MRIILSSAALAALITTAAIAQTTPAPPPPAGPTLQECNKGWHEGLRWTKQAFIKACAELQKQNKP